MLVNEAIAFAEQELKRSNNLNSRLDSEILVSHLINVPREIIYSKLKENLPSNKTEELQKLVNRRAKKEPIAYILNNKEFWSTNFYVDRSVLIPRPETEVLIDLILSHINNKNNYFSILDIGTGSGCILISLLKELISAKGIGVDKSSKAIAIANKNSISQQVNNRATFRNLNLEEIKFDKKFDIIVSNPPYLPDVSLKNLNPDIKLYEPKMALQGGVQGVDFLCKIINLASKILKINGLLALEIGDNQFHNLAKYLSNNRFKILDKYILINKQLRCLLATKL
ncbi:MAG: peptide chain release factor N(5)-glutamine methyltransferase [Proteobacteria bacterium]|nr:peptide chain release factor N(5)-glutamine methyltransferase [Candidatus Fonsibacter lacus]